MLYDISNPRENLSKYLKDTSEVLKIIGLEVCGLPAMYDSTYVHNDAMMFERLLQGMKVHSTLHKYDTINGFINEIAYTDVVISSRLHISLIALLTGRPVLGVSYKSKVRKFYASVGLNDYCYDIGELKQAVSAMDILGLKKVQAGSFKIIEKKKIEAQAGYVRFFRSLNEQ